ncbi:MAG TPA: SpoIIE family protein phosphatase [Gammaproteobacteria bacterium]
MITSSAVRLLDPSSVAEARRVVMKHAEHLGFDEVARSNASIVATELASNLVRHAQNGIIAVTGLASPVDARILLVAVDKGPGVPDVAKCFEDGYSSAGSSGSGLGAVSRLAYGVDAFSTPQGTVLVAELARRPRRNGEDLPVAGFACAKEGQGSNGDAWDCRLIERGVAVLMCDGLGHGVYACEASAAAVAVFRGTPWRSPKETMAAIGEALRPTRGAAVAVAAIDADAGRLGYCGVGNISACIVDHARTRHLVSQNGILGHTASRIAQFEYDWTAESSLVMHSDGISSRWQAHHLEPLWPRHPGLIAGRLYRDFARGNDDVAVVVLRHT